MLTLFQFKKTGSDDIATLKETLLRSLAESQVSWRSESCVSEPSSPVTVGEGAMTFGNSSAFGYKERPTKKTSSASQSFLRPLAEEPERAELKSRLEDPLRRSTPVCQPEGQRKPTGDSLFSCSPISGETGQSSRDVVEPTTPFDLLPKIVTVGTDSTPRNNADSSSLTCGQDVSAVCDQDDTSDVEDEWEPDWVKSIGNPTGPITKVEVTGGNKPPISRLFTDVQSQMPSRRGRTLSLQEPMNNVNCLSASPTTLPSFVEDKKLHIKIPKETTVSLSSSLNFPILSRLPSSGNPSPLSNVIRSATDVPDGAKRPSDSEFLPLWFESQGKDLLRYLLFREGLGQSWFDVIWPLAHKISHTVQPSQQRSNEKKGWNISDFVHIKTVSSTDVPQANVTFGTVCSKAVADCRMTNRFHNPSIMLIGSPIEYERIAGKFCSIDPVIMQESEYLKNVVSKIASHKPHIVVVQQSVARLAQEYLRLANITLVYHLKPTVVDRIARVTGANMVTSIDGQLMKPKLGTCGCFRTETVKLLNGQQKTLMYFEDCEPNRSCSIVLRYNGLKNV